MKQIKVSETTPVQLDWLVAKCVGDFALYHDIEDGQRFLNLWTDSAFLHYSSNWANGGRSSSGRILLSVPYFIPSVQKMGQTFIDKMGGLHTLSQKHSGLHRAHILAPLHSSPFVVATSPRRWAMWWKFRGN